MSALKSILARARRDDRGSVALIFALSCVVLMLLTGLAVDTARYQNLASRMQQALDGASLAAAKLLSDPGMSDEDISERATAYFQAATQTFGVDPSAISPLNIMISRADASVEVLGKVEVPAFFGSFANLPALRVINQKSKVVFDMTAIELAMVLDITGSMKSSNKLEDMKVAAKDVVDTLFDGALNDSNVKIALAPYSASVNAGSIASIVSSVPSTTSCSKPCWWCKTVCTTVAGVDADTCVIERTGGSAFTDAAPSGAASLPNMTLSPAPGNYMCPSADIVPLSDRTHRDDLKAAIDSYVADGATAGHIGTAWGWYLLSPNWASVLPADSAPRAYGDKRVQKNMIVMTDGEFNTAFTGAADEKAESYAYFDRLCENARTAGITIWTVGFDLHDADALKHLETCASSPAQFYDVKTGAQLKDAFKDIANKLGNLRVAS